MRKLLASVILANVASSAFAVPPSSPQPLLGEAQGAATVQEATAFDRKVSENGFDRTPLGERIAEGGFERTPLGERIAEGGFERTPLGERIAEGGFERTPLGKLLAVFGSDRTGHAHG
ncbi:hypothetical protein [Pseudomonas sp.]|uniref:hypothetical protein n=1 Tax=Pseudomonas sp. TaxID=306 RepID=UPI002C245D4B|nr:hypothetical protein [Pseudomonas sp.]HUE90518.1 hypothetical protein [Pseudomonas sp.]